MVQGCWEPINGPADALRHIIATAEMRRRYGAGISFIVTDGNETLGQLSRYNADTILMDRTNNRIGMEIGETAVTYQDVVRRAREAVAAGLQRGGANDDGSPRWLPRHRWRGGTDHPEPDPEFFRTWPAGLPIQTYPAAGPEWRFITGQGSRWKVEADWLRVIAEVPPSDWSDEDVRRVIRSAPYSDSRDPSRVEWHRRVREHFESRALREESQQKELSSDEADDGQCGSVANVKAYTRDGENGPVQVSAHSRRVPCREAG